MYQGNSFRRVYTVMDGDGIAADLTGYTAHLTVGKNPSESAVLAIAGSIVDNVINFVLLPSESTVLPGNYTYDIVVIKENEDAQTIKNGVFVVKDSVKF